MTKIYTPAIRRIVQNLFYGIIASGLTTWFLLSWKGEKIAFSVGGIIIISVLYIIYSNWIKISIENGILYVKKGGEEQSFEIKKCGFRTYETQKGTDIDCVIYIIDPENNEHRIECEALGVFQFEELLEQIKAESSNKSFQEKEVKVI